MPNEYLNEGKKSGNQKGTFVGNPAKTHIHIVKGNSHVKVNNSERTEIRYPPKKDYAKEINNLTPVLTRLIEVRNTSDGAQECEVWLRSYLVDYCEANASTLPR